MGKGDQGLGSEIYGDGLLGSDTKFDAVRKEKLGFSCGDLANLGILWKNKNQCLQKNKK